MRGLIPARVLTSPQLDTLFLGDVSYMILIDTTGHVVRDSLRRLAASDSISDSLGRAWATSGVFSPATLGGCPVMQWLRVSATTSFQIGR